MPRTPIRIARSSWLAMAALLMLSAQAGAQGDAAPMRDAVEAVRSEWQNAYNQGDAAGIAELYAEDAALLPPDADRIEGRSAIQEYWQAGIDAGTGDIDITVDDVAGTDDLAYAAGPYRMAGPEGADAPVTGKALVVLRRNQGGDWLIERHIWNRDGGAEATAAR